MAAIIDQPFTSNGPYEIRHDPPCSQSRSALRHRRGASRSGRAGAGRQGGEAVVGDMSELELLKAEIEALKVELQKLRDEVEWIKSYLVVP